ncbi:MAG TPA: hypothetical protein VMV27_07790 [Candidatus Binataceae bacterium]|nr:hypothetical protein [Candidatus Binataceae bacterium]
MSFWENLRRKKRLEENPLLQNARPEYREPLCERCAHSELAHRAGSCARCDCADFTDDVA